MSDIKTKKMWLPEAMELVKDLRVENEALQARINELERAPQVKVVSERLHTTKRCANQIKAQGIREMLEFYRDCQPPDSTINSLTFEMIQVYADELASDNEALEDKNGI